MSTTTSRLMTAEEFYEWSQRPEQGDRAVELQEGEIVEMSPPGKLHGFVCGNVAGILRDFAISRGKGYVCTNDTGIVVARGPDVVLGPDVTFYEDDESAENMERRFSERPPVLAVEVLSPQDRINRTVQRTGLLLDFGVRLVWIVDPISRDVGVYRKDASPNTLTAEQELTGDDVLPDFRCRVAELFAVPGRG